jgi:protein-L-isoaspartate O-methyltransferase/MFS family permease
MGPSAPLPFARLAGVGLVVFLANAGLLVLQLVAGRLLAPFVGSSLETWTSVIGVFLTGIALGNALGGRVADRYPTPRAVAALLLAGAVAALWMVAFPTLLAATGAHKAVPLGPRIPLLALALCLPAGLVLSLLTPLAIRLGLPDVGKTGRVAGLVFALSTLGCLLGNYLTGFVLIPSFTINTLVYATAGALAALAAVSLVVLRDAPAADEPAVADASGSSAPDPPAANPHAFADVRVAYAVVFLASFGGMTLEITASRVLAQQLGVSLFTWTGIIGVMLAGTALGNLTGGVWADRVNRAGGGASPRAVLAGTLVAGGAGTVLVLVALAVVIQTGAFGGLDPVTQVLAWTFSLFFLPMFLLGMVSPQVIRLAVPDVARAGRVAGRVYAWSTAGAIAGTFAAGYLLLSAAGWERTLLGVAMLLTLTSMLCARVWGDGPILYLFSIVLGGVVGGFILTARRGAGEDLIAQVETNYYTIRVTPEYAPEVDAGGNPVVAPDGREVFVRTGRRRLYLDQLLHSVVDPADPGYLHYEHEHIQVEFLRAARAGSPNPRVLVVGGGGYTFPRYAMQVLPETRMDVVEIDPGVTRVARDHLQLTDYPGLGITHMDGRQFVAERAAPGTYDLVIQDAVNDLSVPAHLLTKEYNDAVKAALKPGGVYLLTVIDSVEYGKLWKAAVHTLRKTYPADHVVLLSPGVLGPGRQVYVIYASDKPFDRGAVYAAVRDQVRPPAAAPRDAAAAGWGAAAAAPGGAGHVLAAAVGGREVPFRTAQVPPERLNPYLDAGPEVVLTDQFAPVDNLMADVFRYRYRENRLRLPKPDPPKE